MAQAVAAHIPAVSVLNLVVPKEHVFHPQLFAKAISLEEKSPSGPMIINPFGVFCISEGHGFFSESSAQCAITPSGCC